MDEYEFIEHDKDPFSDVNLSSDSDDTLDINFEFDDASDIEFFKQCKINLNSNKQSNVIQLKPGMYIVTINPMINNVDQTITFSISKNLPHDEPEISVISNIKGDCDLSIELFWPDNNILLVRKNNVAFNGLYNVDFFVNKRVVRQLLKLNSIDLGPIDELIYRNKDSNDTVFCPGIEKVIDDTTEVIDNTIDDPEKLRLLETGNDDEGSDNGYQSDEGYESETEFNESDNNGKKWKKIFNTILDILFPLVIVSYTVVQVTMCLM